MKMYKTIIMILFFAILCSAQGKGRLLIVGGGKMPESLIQKFVELSGGKDSKLMIIPLASAEPVEAAASFNSRLEKEGCRNVVQIFGNKNSVDDDSNLVKLENCKGIFFTGGDQNKLTEIFNNSKFLKTLKELYKKGTVIGGTSAGAAIMSNIMLTGKELVNKDTVNSYNVIKKGNIETTQGLGFTEDYIIDQHFIKRKRMNRLITVVLENKNKVGLGIDESTAIILNSDKSFQVIGESMVMVFDARQSKNINTDKNNNLGARNLKVHFLQNNDKFKF